MRVPAKIVLFISALCYYLLFAYLSCDLTAKMTTEPRPIGIRSFQDVIDMEYKVVTYGKSFSVNYFKTAPEGSAMRRVYEEQMLKDKNALTKDYGLLFDMVNEDPKTLLYHGYHDYSKEPRWKNLVGLDIEEFANFYVSIGLQKDSEHAEMFN